MDIIKQIGLMISFDFHLSQIIAVKDLILNILVSATRKKKYVISKVNIRITKARQM